MTAGSAQLARSRRNAPAIGAIMLMVAFLVAKPQAAGSATTITVTTTAEEQNVDGDCSLREAIAAANGDAPVDACPAGSGADTIVVPAGTYPVGAALSVASNLTISGGGAATTILDGGNSNRVLSILGSVTVQGVTIRNGNAGSGGGILNGGTLTVTNSTISGNTASGGGAGGGILSGAPLTVTNSTIAGNTASGIGGYGGGIVIDTGEILTVTNSTIAGNTASDRGGGILSISGATLTVTNSTISGNTATSGGGILNGIGATATLTNTIMANNDCSGTITDGGNNLSFPGTTCPGINADPVLGGLQPNGGPTPTMALGAGSAAIDAVPAGNLACPATDQRGIFRPQGPSCDIGAFEVEVVSAPDLEITKSCTASSPATFTCTLIVTNPSADVAATNVVVTDDLPPGLTAGPVTKSNMSFTCVDPPGAVDIHCTSPSLAGGASATFTYTVSIGETASPGQSFTNNAAVSSSTEVRPQATTRPRSL